MPRPALHLRAAVHVPQLDRSILACRREHIRIRAETEAIDGGLMAIECVKLRGGSGLPDAQAAVAIPARQQHAIGAVSDSGDPIRVLRELVQQLSVGNGKDLQQFSRPAQRDS